MAGGWTVYHTEGLLAVVDSLGEIAVDARLRREEAPTLRERTRLIGREGAAAEVAARLRRLLVVRPDVLPSALRAERAVLRVKAAQSALAGLTDGKACDLDDYFIPAQR